MGRKRKKTIMEVKNPRAEYGSKLEPVYAKYLKIDFEKGNTSKEDYKQGLLDNKRNKNSINPKSIF